MEVRKNRSQMATKKNCVVVVEFYGNKKAEKNFLPGFGVKIYLI